MNRLDCHNKLSTTRTKLRSRPEFGQCSQVPFADVLALAERK
jgi:hypothetical protein